MQVQRHEDDPPAQRVRRGATPQKGPAVGEESENHGAECQRELRLQETIVNQRPPGDRRREQKRDLRFAERQRR